MLVVVAIYYYLFCCICFWIDPATPEIYVHGHALTRRDSLAVCVQPGRRPRACAGDAPGWRDADAVQPDLPGLYRVSPPRPAVAEPAADVLVIAGEPAGCRLVRWRVVAVVVRDGAGRAGTAASGLPVDLVAAGAGPATGQIGRAHV